MLIFIISQIFFILLLLSYQKKDKIYIGYTTVMTLFFGFILLISLISWASGYKGSQLIITLLILSHWGMGAILIYLTSQLTLAFEKIRQLSQHIALKEIPEKEVN